MFYHHDSQGMGIRERQGGATKAEESAGQEASMPEEEGEEEEGKGSAGLRCCRDGEV